ncbi:hypothetical protein [Aureimonas pseudogalii]|uniref:Uncharacterized protein n=1 Tax=Aureimonas pseudogalii TaxID=1744844 RepID=A0A7W6H5D7_9HYPH|nr:hypothetical protein [Aureimonas pseudogalii]MBB3998869.1 hypothetical protein [Aureimonas pseudogalii]
MSPSENLAALAQMKYDGQQMLHEGVALGWPISLTLKLVRAEMRSRNLMVPADMTAWLWDGRTSDRTITNPFSPVGG